ncbi:MAG: Lrp/AsnC family transcriptional regulator [Thermoplasmata archaeon]
MILKIVTDSLDEIDLKIIDLLSNDGRITDTEIARKIGLSKTSVRLRKLKLIESGKIKVLGLPIFRNLNLIDADVFIKFKVNTSQIEIENAVKKLSNEEFVYEINRYIYKYDLSIAVYHKDFASLKIYLQELFKDLKYIESYEIYPVVQTDKSFGVLL